MAEEEAQISYEDLALIEEEFEQVDVDIVRKQYELTKPLYAKRAEAVAKIPNFWPLVLEQSPLHVDQYIQPNDSRIFVDSLLSIDVVRHEIENGANGSPRSFTLKFTFKPNDDFEETVLEKKFDYRRASDGFTGLVSEPVKITWKSTEKDLTEGLTDGALALWEARKKKGDMTSKDVPEYAALAEKVESWNGSNTSFFTFFGWVSSRRWVSAEESAKANEEFAKRQEARKRGDEIEMPEEDDEEFDDSDVEVHEGGEDLAISFADDVWPNAIKFFTEAQEMEDMSDVDFEDYDEDEDEEGEPVDIRALVGKGRKRESDVGPSSKKQKN